MTLNRPDTYLHALPCLSRSRRVRSDVVRGTPDAPSDPPATARVARLGQSRLFQQGIVGTFADVDDDLVCPGLDDSRGVDELPEQSGRARPDETLQSFGQPAVQEVREYRQRQVEVHVQSHVTA